MYESYIVDLLKEWGYACIFVGMFFEGLTVPFPGAFLVILAGALALKLNLSLGGIVFYSFLGYAIGALFPYYLAKVGGRKFLIQYGKYLFLNPQVLQLAEFWFQKYGKWVVCLTRPFFFGNYVSYLAGLTNMHLGAFLLFTGLGIFSWSGVLALSGYYFGRAGLLLIREYSWYALGIFLVAVLALYGLKKLLRRSWLKTDS